MCTKTWLFLDDFVRIRQFQRIAFQKLFPTTTTMGTWTWIQAMRFMFLRLLHFLWTRDLSPGDDVSFGPLGRVWTDDGSIVSIPSGHSGTYVLQDLPFDRRPHFSRYDSWRESCHREKTPTPWMEATSQKSNPNPSQGEKECAACLLMIKQCFTWHM